MALEQTGVQFIAAGGDVYITTLQKATSSTNTFVDATDKGGSKVSAAGQVMIGALRQVGEIAVNALGQAAQATASFLKDSIGVAGDFEAGMHKFQAVAGAGVDTKSLEKFKDLFIDLGKELPVSTSEVEQAAIEMVSGGIDPAIVQAGALRSTIQFAAASGLSLADAAATSAKFLAGWTSASASTADKVAFLTSSTDALTKAAAASSTTAAELRLGIFNVQGAAQALHAPFTDVVATLAELAPAFESSAQAGTALNVFMTRLEPQTKPARAAMEELGIITKENQNLFFDSTGAFLGMGNAAEVLRTHMSGLSDEEKISTLHQLFGNDAMKVGNLLMQDGAAGIDAMKSKMDAANGVSATAALMQSGYNTALENAKGSVEALQIRIGGFLIPVLTDLLNNAIAPAINAVTDWVTSIISADDPLQAFITQLDLVSPILGTVVAALADFVTTGGDLGVVADDLNDGMAGLGTAFLGVADEVARLADAFATGSLSGMIDQLISDITAALPDIESALQVWGQALVDWIAPMIPPALQALGDLASQAWAWVQSQAPGWGQQLLSWGQALVDWIAPMIPPAIAALGNLATQFFTWVGAQAAPLLAKLHDWANAFTAWIGPATVAFLQEWPGMLDKFLDWVGTSAGPILKQLGDWAVSFIAWVVPMIPGFLLEVGKIALAIGVFIGETSIVLNKRVLEWAVALTEWVGTDAIPKLLEALGEMWSNINDWGMQVEKDIGNLMVDVGSSLVQGIKRGVEDAWGSFVNWISEKVHSTVGAVMDAIGAHSPATEFMPVGAFAVQGIMQGFSDEWPALTDQIGGLSADLVNKMQDLGGQIQSAIADSFGATASIDRQVASNLDKFKDILPQYQQYTTGALKDAQSQAEGFLDPAQGAKFFQMRSKQILEYAKLQKDLDNAASQEDKDRIAKQMQLINQAQTAEISQFDATKAATSPLLDIANQINDVLKVIAGINLTDDQIQIVSQLSGVWAALQSPVNTRAAQYANPPQTQYTAGSQTSYSQSTTYNMPVYTNDSPAALQQSMAVMRAGMI